MNENVFIIKIDCKDTVGLVYSIAQSLYERNINIISLQEHVDAENSYFFARVVCDPVNKEVDLGELEKDLREHFQKTVHATANISFHRRKRKRVIVMATKEYHCLGELLLRAKYDDLNAEVLAVIANREGAVAQLCKSMNSPFHYVPVEETDSREQHEEKILKIIAHYNPEYIVLARYMRILSADFTSLYAHRIINIHHSFLPAFIGANPYRQAYERGVKVIGATAHFVTETLDEGPIIAQQVKDVDHGYGVKDLQRVGRNIEKLTLMNALENVFNDRVFVHGSKTIVF